MRASFTYCPPMEPVSVLFETDQVLFVDKPAGLLSVPGRQSIHKDSLFTRLKDRDPDIRLIHRLDMDTSGVMIFAKTLDAQRAVSRQFEKRTVSKIYLAEVDGHPDKSGTIDLPLMADWPNRPLQKVDHAGKPSTTHWAVLKSLQDTSIVELIPETGRSHQLRVHMAALGHAIVGDPFYANAALADAAPRMHLHAYSLSVDLPNDGARKTVFAPCDFFATE